MIVAKIFKNGRSRAVRIPKQFKLEGDEVEIFQRGDEIVLRPHKKRSALEILEVLGGFSDDFMAEGRQQGVQVRKGLDTLFDEAE